MVLLSLWLCYKSIRCLVWNICQLTRILTWKFLSNPGPWSSAAMILTTRDTLLFALLRGMNSITSVILVLKKERKLGTLLMLTCIIPLHTYLVTKSWCHHFYMGYSGLHFQRGRTSNTSAILVLTYERKFRTNACIYHTFAYLSSHKQLLVSSVRGFIWSLLSKR